METLAEQIEYGDHCIHGVNIGTPGGADLMCGLCEDGCNMLHDDPSYTLLLTFGQEAPEWNGEGLQETWWRLSDLDSLVGAGRVWDKIEARAQSWQKTLSEILNREDLPVLFWEARLVDHGYWDQT